MKSKRPARNFALQTLYAMEVGDQPIAEVIGGVLENHEISDSQKEYGMKLLNLVQENREVVLEKIEQKLINWEWSRVAKIDQILLLIATAELLFCPDVPPQVVLAEATAIGNKFSAEDSPSFINGTLKAIAQDVSNAL